MRSFRLLSLCVALSCFAGCASNHTGNHLSLVANHPSNIALEVPVALMKSAQIKCKRLNANAEISGIDQYKPDALNHPEKMRSVLYFSCVEIPQEAIAPSSPSPVRDLAKGKTVAPNLNTSARNQLQGPSSDVHSPTPLPAPTTLRETKPVSAELPIFSAEQGEPAGVGPVVVFENKNGEPAKTQVRPVVITQPKKDKADLVPVPQVPSDEINKKIEPVATNAPEIKETIPIATEISPLSKAEPKDEPLVKTNSESHLKEIPLETGSVVRIEEYPAEDEYL